VQFDTLLSTIILVTFLVTVVMAVGSYIAFKLREGRRPQPPADLVEGESAFFERVHADDIVRATEQETRHD
jgi:heme/copper-type cytochrome/quinol oxidase subunit 2